MFKKLYILAMALLPATFQVAAQQSSIDEVTVIGSRQFLQTEFDAERTSANVDSAKLMNQVPGGAATNNGPLTGQIQYRGMFGPRINVTVDEMLIHGGGPNWMAPPLHHIPAGLIDSLVVEQGIASVATGGGIGGAVTAYWKKPDFSIDEQLQLSGDLESAFSSVDDGTSLSALVGMSNRNHRLFAVASLDAGDDYESAEGTVDATQYERETTGIGYGFRNGNQHLDIDYRRLRTDDTGTPSLPLDIEYFYTDFWKSQYGFGLGNGDLTFTVYGSDIEHRMNNYRLRPAPDFSSLMLPPFLEEDRRFVETASDEFGYKAVYSLTVAGGSLIAGVDNKQAKHEATVFDPDFAMFFVNNFADVETENTGAFAQWSKQFAQRWYIEGGIRFERVVSEAGDVDAFPARLVDADPAMWPMGTPPRAVWMLREQFNNSDREQRDNNVDWVLKTRYQMTSHLVAEFGLAQKTRSPIYQERYMWIPLEVNAGLGDGNNYVGNLDLDPEVSQQIEVGLNWVSNSGAYVSPRFYYREVEDYIQGMPATNMAAVAVSANANGDPTPLTYANTEATIYGFDAQFGLSVSDRLQFDGILSWVRGERDDIDDNLYRIAPPSLSVKMTWDLGKTAVQIEQRLIARQDKLAATNTQDPTNSNNSFYDVPGYGLTNLLVTSDIADSLTLTGGVENLFDKHYVDYLSGFNRVLDSSVGQGQHLDGPGRNIYARLQYQF